MSTDTKVRPKINATIADSCANKAAARQRGVPCTLEDVTKYFYSIEETNKLVMEVAKAVQDDILDGLVEVVGRPYAKRLGALEEKQSTLGDASVLGETMMRVEVLEKRPSNTTMFAEYDKRLVSMAGKIDRLLQSNSALQKEVAALKRAVHGGS